MIRKETGDGSLSPSAVSSGNMRNMNKNGLSQPKGLQEMQWALFYIEKLRNNT